MGKVDNKTESTSENSIKQPHEIMTEENGISIMANSMNLTMDNSTNNIPTNDAAKSNNKYSVGINLTSYVDFDAWPEVTCEYLISADEMPQILQLSDQVNSVILK